MKKTTNTPTRRTVLLAAMGGGLALLAEGCGGGGTRESEGRTGRMTFTVTWPEPTRLIPQASKSIQIQVLNGEKVVKTALLTLPTTKITIEDLPAKKLINLVQAFPNADGSGVAQAQVRSEVEIKADETIKISLTMQSTIVRLEPSHLEPIQLELNAQLTLTATPRDADNKVVLIKPDTLEWSSSNPAAVSVDKSGVITCVGAGEVVITATEPESGKTITFTVNAGPIDRIVFSEIKANVRGTNFIQTEPGTFHDFGGGNLAINSYDFHGPIPPPSAEVSTREFTILLSKGISVGTRVAVDGTATTPPVSQVRLLEIENVYDNFGNLVRYRERNFEGVSGHVTLVKIEGLTHTVRVENVKLQGSGMVVGGGNNIPITPEGSGTFVVDGTVRFISND